MKHYMVAFFVFSGLLSDCVVVIEEWGRIFGFHVSLQLEDEIQDAIPKILCLVQYYFTM